MIVAIALLIVMMMVVLVMMTAHRTGLHHIRQLPRQRILPFHCGQNLSAIQLIPRSSNDHRLLILLTDHRNAGGQLILRHIGRAAEHDAAGVSNLIVVEFSKVLHIYTALGGICNGCKAVQLHIVGFHLFHRIDHIAELAYTRRFDKNAVGAILYQHLLQSLGEIAHQTAANAAGVHLGNLNARLFHKAAVDSDLTKLVFDKHQLLPCIRLSDQFFDQRGLAGTQKAGKHINLGHNQSFPSLNLLNQYTTFRRFFQPPVKKSLLHLIK